jgi:ABC-type sugar transport system substrate-binding protein
VLKKAMVSLAALSFMANPVLAQSAAAAPAPEPAAETVEGNELYRTGFIIPLLGVTILILVILAATETFPFDDDEPVSP